MTDLPDSCRWRTVSTDEPRPTAKWIVARVMAMLSHYYQPELSPEVDELAMANWIDVLADLPKPAVDQAIAEWLRGETKRPTPASIRKRAQARMAPKKPPPPDDDEWPFRPVVVPPEEIQRRRDMQTEIRRAFPMLRKATKCEGDGA